MDRVNLLASAIASVVNFTDDLNYKINLPDDITENEFEILKDVLIMNRQQELYVRNLIENLIIVKNSSNELIQYFRKVLDEIHENVQYKTAVSTDLVFVRKQFNPSP